MHERRASSGAKMIMESEREKLRRHQEAGAEATFRARESRAAGEYEIDWDGKTRFWLDKLTEMYRNDAEVKS